MTGSITGRTRRKPFEIDGLITEILRQSSKPIGAYEIARQAREKSHRISPTQVYRCLDRLLEAKEVEQIVSINAYATAPGCNRIHLLCKTCGEVISVDEQTPKEALLGVAESVMFEARITHVEVLGQCRSCRA